MSERLRPEFCATGELIAEREKAATATAATGGT
jgi:hypothetical protein